MTITEETFLTSDEAKAMEVTRNEIRRQQLGKIFVADGQEWKILGVGRITGDFVLLHLLQISNPVPGFDRQILEEVRIDTLI